MTDPTLAAPTAYIAALNDKNLDAAVEQFAEDAEMQTPMGLKSGKKEIRSLLEMLSRMPSSGPVPPPALEDGQIVARSKSMMGTARLVFQVEAGLIRRIDVHMGG